MLTWTRSRRARALFAAVGARRLERALALFPSSPRGEPEHKGATVRNQYVALA